MRLALGWQIDAVANEHLVAVAVADMATTIRGSLENIACEHDAVPIPAIFELMNFGAWHRMAIAAAAAFIRIEPMREQEKDDHGGWAPGRCRFRPWRPFPWPFMGPLR